jgi:hypothetical protein
MKYEMQADAQGTRDSHPQEIGGGPMRSENWAWF